MEHSISVYVACVIVILGIAYGIGSISVTLVSSGNYFGLAVFVFILFTLYELLMWIKDNFIGD